MANEAKHHKVYEALQEEYLRHDMLTRSYQARLKDAQENESRYWVVQDLEDKFHLHNCITAVLRDILYTGEEMPDMSDSF